jgi:hypothetical protein
MASLFVNVATWITTALAAFGLWKALWYVHDTYGLVWLAVVVAIGLAVVAALARWLDIRQGQRLKEARGPNDQPVDG